MVKPIVALYSESGSGKSFSALLLARGLVGPSGNIQVLDTEGGRGELYSDVIPGGYNVIPFSEPFSPARYVEAITYAESQGADVILVDQCSSEWEGPGGVLDMAGENEAAGKKGLSVWKTPKMEHAQLIGKLLRSKCPIIVCLRAKYKSRQVKQGGRTEIVKDEHLTATQDESFIYETTVHGYVTQDHAFHPTKISHPSLGSCFPNGTPIEERHGQLLRQWCEAPGAPATAAKPPTDKLAATLKTQLWELTASIHGRDKVNGPSALETWLREEKYITAEESLTNLPANRLTEVIANIQAR